MLGRKEKERKNPEKDRQRNIGRQKEAKIGKKIGISVGQDKEKATKKRNKLQQNK